MKSRGRVSAGGRLALVINGIETPVTGPPGDPGYTRSARAVNQDGDPSADCFMQTSTLFEGEKNFNFCYPLTHFTVEIHLQQNWMQIFTDCRLYSTFLFFSFQEAQFTWETQKMRSPSRGHFFETVKSTQMSIFQTCVSQFAPLGSGIKLKYVVKCIARLSDKGLRAGKLKKKITRRHFNKLYGNIVYSMIKP